MERERNRFIAKLTKVSDQVGRRAQKRLVAIALGKGFLPKHPFGKSPVASAKHYESLFAHARRLSHPEIDDFEARYRHKIPTSWLEELALQTQVVVKSSPLNWQHGRVLYCVLRDYLEKAKRQNLTVTVLETGTARGFSAVTMARAIVDSDSTGMVLTLDLLPHNTAMMWNSISDISGPKSRSQLLSAWKEELDRIVFVEARTGIKINNLGLSRVHFAFLDAGHTRDDVLAEYQFVEERQTSGDVIIFDDVTDIPGNEVRAAVEIIRKSGKYEVLEVGNFSERSYALAVRR